MIRGVSVSRALAGAAMALGLTVGGLSAQDAAAPMAMKVGVFNADRILAESQAGQQALAQLDQLQQQRLTELQAQQQSLNELQQQALQAPPGSPEAAQLQRQLEDRGIQFQRLQQDVQVELQQRQQSLTQPIVAQIGEIIDRLGADESFTMIFNALQSGLVYVDESVDITDRIIQELDAATAAGGGL